MSSLHPSDCIASQFTTSGEVLEGVLSGKLENGELRPLLNNRHKYFTVVPKPFMLFGAYNKINYIAACFKACLMTNNEHEPKTKSLLCFGGGFSRFGSTLAFLLSLVLFVLPFAAVWPFVEKPKNGISRYLLIVVTCMEFLLFLWHSYCIYIMKVKNLDVWLNSWFTFCVETETLEDNENSAKSHSFFHLRGKLRVMDISVSDLYRLNSRLHQLTATKREKLASIVEKHRLEQAAIILYSEEFISEFITCSMFGIFVLAVLSAGSTAILAWKTCTIWLHL